MTHIENSHAENSELRARKWVEFLSGRPEFPPGRRLLAAFNAGTLTRLCDCGCNSFDIDVPADRGIEPLSAPGASGSVFQMTFLIEEFTTLDFVVFAAASGQFAGLEVDYCANSYPVPHEPKLQEPPTHIWVSGSLNPRWS